jgi:hypothetical protein
MFQKSVHIIVINYTYKVHICCVYNLKNTIVKIEINIYIYTYLSILYAYKKIIF